MLTRERFERRVVQLCLKSGLVGLPRKFEDRHVLLKAVALTLREDEAYGEPEINEALRVWLGHVGRAVGVDHVSLRRALVDYGYLGRDAGGSVYRLRRPKAEAELFAPEVDEVDVASVLRAARGNAGGRAPAP
jgi:hypothetical protein